ncbi:cholinesterase-like [Thalassophryne amazonica]|uniref:cholinesterase-like n=1 Tax=Thalassophryne amazonica TaxID=390379 RepID=UPI0014718224|nr:cholinesterase-like [Thalassophryne amazonica]
MATVSLFLYFTILALLLQFFSPSLATQDDLLVSTKHGIVRGMFVSVPGGAVRAFLGIPYGKPPLGALRFRAPEPADGWEGVRDATKFSNSCYQERDTTFPGFKGSEMWNPNTPLNEDCLYLNIWAPHFNKSKTQHSTLAPVLVWIYGGGFTAGTSSLDVYDGRYLSKSEGVIVVSMNYRIGALGFLSLPDNKNIRGNAGLLDQRLALSWVENNIAAFGGDPKNVTLFGESAGAAGVGLHLLSPGSNTLFQRAVLQSASPNVYWATLSQKEAWERAASLAKKVDCPVSPQSAMEACLQKIEPEKLIQLEFNVHTQPSFLYLPFIPVVDGDFLPDNVDVLLDTGKFAKKEVVIGLNKDEGTYFVLYSVPGYNITGQSLISQTNFLQGMVLAMPDSDNVTRESAILQYTEMINQDNGTENRDMLGRMIGDKVVTCPALEFAYKYSQQGGKCFVYLFDHRSSTNPWPTWAGVMHGYEIEFVFGIPLNESLGYTKKEVNMTRKFMKHWANFARTGNPGIDGVDWPVFTPERQEYVTLNSDNPQHKSMMKAKECHFWNKLFPKIPKVSDDMCTCVQDDGTTIGCNCTLLLMFLLLTLIN